MPGADLMYLLFFLVGLITFFLYLPYLRVNFYAGNLPPVFIPSLIETTWKFILNVGSKVEDLSNIKFFNMSRLIIHIGPPKCGSSTIQSFLKQKPFKEKVKFRVVTAKTINSFVKYNANSDRFNDLVKHLNTDLKRYDAVAISHEYLFGHTPFLENLCKLTNADDIKIIGYSRKQSDFIMSAYFQWEFRSKDSFEFYSQVLKRNNIDPIYFTGLEAFIVSVVLSDFNSGLEDPRYRIFNWDFYYNEIRDAIPNSKVLVNCLPGKNYQYDLINDFCNKANLTAKGRKLKRSDKKVNQRFAPSLTESVYNALASGLNVPDGRFHNYFLEDLSIKLGRDKDINNAFIGQLSDYIDSTFAGPNGNLCKIYNIPPEEFEPKRKINKSEILEAIYGELEKRRKNPEEIISYYKKLTGEWAHFCFYSRYGNFFNKIAVLHRYL